MKSGMSADLLEPRFFYTPPEDNSTKLFWDFLIQLANLLNIITELSVGDNIIMAVCGHIIAKISGALTENAELKDRLEKLEKTNEDLKLKLGRPQTDDTNSHTRLEGDWRKARRQGQKAQGRCRGRGQEQSVPGRGRRRGPGPEPGQADKKKARWSRGGRSWQLGKPSSFGETQRYIIDRGS
jgi:hypothetical protein